MPSVPGLRRQRREHAREVRAFLCLRDHVGDEPLLHGAGLCVPHDHGHLELLRDRRSGLVVAGRMRDDQARALLGQTLEVRLDVLVARPRGVEHRGPGGRRRLLRADEALLVPAVVGRLLRRREPDLRHLVGACCAPGHDYERGDRNEQKAREAAPLIRLRISFLLVSRWCLPLTRLSQGRCASSLPAASVASAEEERAAVRAQHTRRARLGPSPLTCTRRISTAGWWNGTSEP